MRPRDSRATTPGDSQTLGDYSRPRPVLVSLRRARIFGIAGLERYWWTSANMSRQNAISDLRPHLKPQTKLSTSMTQAQFDNGYWYATELKEFAKTVGIPSASRLRKDGLEKAIKVFLKAGKIESPAKGAHRHLESRTSNKD